ncbi:Imidazole glycerol phosphate synthase hisHF, chloroplastic, partial [Cladochytrium tenue]
MPGTAEGSTTADGNGGDSGGLWLLDYGAGNVRSLVNAVRKLGYSIRRIETPADILAAK